MLCVSHLHTHKNIERLIVAVHSYKNNNNSALKLYIAGKKADLRYVKKLENLVAECGLKNDVIFTGMVTKAELNFAYSKCRLFVFPSLCESSGYTLIEAMSCGVPLVTTTGGALPEVAGPHDETCFQVPPGDSEALASMIGKVLDSSESRSRVGENGRQRVIENWSWHHTALRTVEQYHLLLAESRDSHVDS